MATKAFLISAIIASIAVQAFSTDYIVGDDSGWKLGVDYTQWAQGKNFYVGDRLIFKYPQGAHNVYRVNGTLFQECTKPPSPSEALISGNDVITLATPGKKWYLCGVGSHCASGMKLAITIGSTEAPAPAPTLTSAAATHEPSSSSSRIYTCMILIAFAAFNFMWA